MAVKRLSPLRLSFILIAALAAWVSAGALSVASSQPEAARLGVLPSGLWLASSVAVAVGLALVIRPAWTAWLAVSGLLLLPWLPVAVPDAFYIWVGHLRAWLWIVLAGAIAAPFIRIHAPRGLAAAARDPRRAPRLAAIVATAAYLAGAYQVLPQLPTGDEPHYLIIANSLLSDRDLKVENNYRQQDYRAYFAGTLRPDYLRRGQDSEIYSIHAPGLPALVAPVFALFGYSGVLALLAAVSGAATGVAWSAAWRVTEDAGAAWFGWAAVALSAPFFFQSFVMYPDALGAAIVMLGVSTMVQGRFASDRRRLATGAALALLPWLHLRLAIAAGVLGLLIAGRQFGTAGWRRRLIALFAIPAVSAGCWFAFFYVIYGTPDPRAPYGGSTQSSLAGVARGLAGLAFDQQFGLLPNAPIYLCAVLGFLPLARRDRRTAIELVTLILPYTLAVAAFQMWWGGTSSPARFLTPVLLTLAIPSAFWFHDARGRASRLLGLGALAVSVLITATIAAVDRGAMLYNFRDGRSRLLSWISPLVDLTTGVPSLFQNEPLLLLGQAAVWLAAIALTAAAGTAIARRTTSAPAIVAALAVAGAVTGMTALSIVWRSNQAAPITPTTASAALLQTINRSGSLVAIQYRPLQRIALADLPPRLTLATFPPPKMATPPAPDEPLAWVPHPPAATYVVEVVLSKPGSGRITVSLERQLGAAWSWTLDGSTGVVRREFRLPVEATSMVVDGDAAARATIDRVTVRALAARSASDRAGGAKASHVARYGPALVFLTGGRADMEPAGTWIAGESHGDFVIAPDDVNAPIRLFVRNPPVENRITLEAGDWRQDLAFTPGEERLFEIPAIRGRVAVPLRVTSARGARPAEFERGSTDTRFLGCWIETR
jgi:hypothetical protein